MGSFIAKFKPILVPLLLIVLVVIIIVTNFDKLKPKSNTSDSSKVLSSSIEIIATKQDKNGIDPKSQFEIKSDQPIDSDAIKSSLKINPSTSFTLEKKNATTLLVSFDQPLIEEKVYKFSLPALVGGVQSQEFTWAFQIKSPFAVTGSLPAPNTSSFPLNGSIEFYLNNTNFSPNKDFFEITPSVQGRLEKHQNALVFIPDSLKQNTLYTVTLKKNFSLDDSSSRLSKDYTIQFETQSDYKKPVKRTEFSRTLLELSPNKPAIIPVENYEPLTTKLKLYQASQDQFRSCLNLKASIPSWSYYSRWTHRCPITSSPKEEYDLTTKKSGDYGQYYFELPRQLSAGYYLLEARNEDDTISQQAIEVTPFTWYYWFGYEQGVFWVSNQDTGKVEEGVAISLGDQQLGKTDQNGLLKISTPELLKQKSNQLLTLKKDNQNIYSLNTQTPYDYQSTSKTTYQSKQYWSYLYADRSLYQTSDKINFWGLVKPRNDNNLPKITAKLVVGNVNYWGDDDGAPEVIATKELALSSYNSFSGLFNIDNLNPGWYSIALYDGSTYINQRGFSIQRYQKPVYQISAIPEKIVLFKGQKNNIKVKASFYDGTPVSNTTFEWSSNGYSSPSKGQITTNSVGEANIEITTQSDSSDYNLLSGYVNIRPKIQQNYDIYAEAGFVIFNSDINFSSKNEWKDNKTTVTFETKKINLAEAQNDPWKTPSQPYPNLETKIVIDRVWYDRIEDGTTYDPVNKITNKHYRYERKTERTSEMTLTSDSQGKAKFDFPAAKDQQFEISLSATDGSGRTTSNKIYSYANSSFYENETIFFLSADKEKYQIGDNADIQLKYGDVPVPTNDPNRYFVFLVKNGQIIDQKITNESRASFEFKKDLIPNVYVLAVWFNGKEYKSSQYGSWRNSGLSLVYDTAPKDLKLEVKTDKNKYLPGDQVKGNIKVSQNGQPVKSTVMVSVVDEQMSGLGGIDAPNILSSLYDPLPDGMLVNYVSHPHPRGGGAEGGGGDGGRDNFVDVAYFSEIETGPDGIAEFGFKIPDNITSWRLTSAAVTSSLDAGETKYLIPVSKPIFVNVVTATDFIKDDQPKIQAIAYGDILSNDSNVKYTLKASSLNLSSKEINAPAFKPVEFELPALPTGEHKIEVWAESNGQRDGVINQISVSDSRLQLLKNDFVELKNIYQPSMSTTKAVSFFITDKGRSLWLSRLQPQITNNVFGKDERLDRLLSQSLARKLTNEYLQTSYDTSVVYGKYYKDGGLSLVPQSTLDPEIIVKAVATHLDSLNQSELTTTLWKLFRKNQDLSSALIPLWGLAESQQPVLTIIKQLSAQAKTPQDYTYLALSATALGDQPLAKQLFSKVTINQRQPYRYVDVENFDQRLKLTALAAVISARLGNVSDVDKFFLYLEDNPSSNQIFDLEKILAINGVLTTLTAQSSSIKYTINGQVHQQTLNADIPLKITIPSKDLASSSFETTSGSVGMMVQWWQNASTSSSTTSDMSLKMSLNPTTDLAGISSYVVTIDPNISQSPLKGNYLVTVNLPSGLQYLEAYKLFAGCYECGGRVSWPSLIDGQKIVFNYYNQENIIFYARVINRGKFQVEPAIINHGLSTDRYSFSDKLPVLNLN